MSLPEKSKVAVFYGPGKGFFIEEFVIPDLERNEILVKVDLCTICGSDIHTFTGRRSGPVPGSLGHEITGSIVALGKENPGIDYNGLKLKTGDRITWLMYSFNPNDEMSKKGLPQKSNSLFKYGHEEIAGGNALHSGFAEYLIIREGTSVYKLPDTIRLKVSATINCGLATAMASVKSIKPLTGDRIAVLGCGILGLYTIAILKSLGITNIDAYDIDAERIILAREMGAEEGFVFTPQLKKSYNIIFDMSGSPEAMKSAVSSLKPGGTAVFAGAVFRQKDFSLNGESIVRNILTIKGVYNYNPDDLRDSIVFLEKFGSRYPFDALVEKVFPLEDINDAFEYAISEKPIRVGVSPYEKP